MIEYSLVAALVGIGSVGAMTMLGGQIGNQYEMISSSIKNLDGKAGGAVATQPTYEWMQSKERDLFFKNAGAKLPPKSKGWGIYTNKDEAKWNGWKGTFEISNPRTYGVPPTDSDYVIELDTRSNSKMIKQFAVEEGKKVKFSMETVMRNNGRAIVGKDGFDVVWNGEVVKTVLPNKNLWQTDQMEFVGGSGDGSNTLEIRAIGPSNSIGGILGNFDAEVETLVDPAT